MQQDWIYALCGGLLIGVSASIMLIVNNRVAGISGIFYGAMRGSPSQRVWRLRFLLGLLLGGLIASRFVSVPFTSPGQAPWGILAIAGFLVGFGTRLGSGCTSGHGVCGIGRVSKRSIIATMTFIAAGVVTVYVMSFFGGIGL